jgi:hypothetical protein
MVFLMLLRRFTSFKGLLYLLTHSPWVILAKNDYDADVCMELP